MPFTEVPAPLVPDGQDVISGGIRVLAGTRIATLSGLGGNDFSLLPPNTLFGNLSGGVRSGVSWDMFTFAGTGLSYLPAAAGGNAPEIKSISGQAFSVAATSHTYTYPPGLVAGDVLVVAIATGGLTTITPPATWTHVGSQATSASITAVYKRVITGLEGASETVTFGTASGAIVHDWLLDKASGDMEVTSALNDSGVGTSLDIGSVTPSWAVAEATNNFYLAVIGLDIEAASTISAFPAGYIGTGQDAIASATAAINCRIGFAYKTSLSQTEDPGAFTYGAARAGGLIVAIRPLDAGRLNWDGLSVRKNSAGSVFTRPRLNLIEGTGITLTVADDGTDNEVDVTITNSGSGGTAGWDDVLLVDNHSGASNAIVDDAQYIQWGVATPPASGQARTNEPFLFNADKSWHLLAGEEIQLTAFDTSLFRVTAGGLTVRSFDALNVTSDDADVNITSTLHDIDLLAAGLITLTAPVVTLPTGFLRFTEAASSTPSMSAGQGLFWVKNDTPNNPFFTDDTNADRQIATLPIPLSGVATIASDTFLGNVSGSTAAPSAVNLSTLAGAGLVFGTHTFDVTAGAGGSIVVGANDVQRAALTGAITASQDSNTTAFGALAAKSVLANATNASAVPAALAGSAAFQHLRVNSANTGLEWSVFTTGDFPANSVPITALATITAKSVLANATNATATPTAVASSGANQYLRVNAANTALEWGTLPASTVGWNDVLAVNAASGPNDPIVSAGRFMQFGAVGPTTSSPQIRSGDTFFRIGCSGGFVTSADTISLSALGGNFIVGAAGAVALASAGAATFQGATVSLNTSSTPRVVIGSTGEWTTPTGTSGQVWTHTGAAPPSWSSVANASMAAMLANTIKANATAGVAVPGDLAIAAESVAGRTSGNLQSITSSVQSVLMRGAGSVFWGTAAADQVFRRSGSGDLGFGTLVTNNIGDDQVSLAKIVPIAANTVLVNATASTDNPTAFALATNQVLGRAGGNITALTVGTNTVLGRVAGNLVAGQVVGAQVATNTLAYTKLAKTATGRKILGNPSDGSDDIIELDQLTTTMLMAIPATNNSHGIMWEDEDFTMARNVYGGFTVATTTTVDVFNGTTGVNGHWHVTSGTGTSTVTFLGTGTIGHKGIIRLTTGATSGNSCVLYLGRDGSSPATTEAVFDADDFLSMDWYVMLPELTLKFTCIGIGQNVSDPNFGTQSVFMFYDSSAGANWFAAVRAASTYNVSTDTGFAAVAGNWVKLTIRRVSSSAWDFYINNALFLASSGAGPTGGVVPGALISTRTSAAKNLDVDRCRIFLNDRALFD